MLPTVRNWLGPIGWRLATLVLFAAAGTLGAWLAAPLGPIPIIGLVAILFVPFPTALLYLGAILLLFLALRGLMGRWRPGRPVREGLVAVVATLAVGGAGWWLPSRWNAAAGVGGPPATALAPVALPGAGRIALVSQGYGNAWEACQSFCLALLLSNRIEAVDTALAVDVPEPLAVLPGWRIRPRGADGADSRACLQGREHYYGRVIGGDEDERRRYFAEGLGSRAWTHYIEPCFDVVAIQVDPAAQLTLVNFSRRMVEDPDSPAGFLPDLELRRIIEPRAAGAPTLREAQGRTLRRYAVPLMIWPFAGDAASGGRLEARLATEFYDTLPYERSSEANWWPLVVGGDELLARTSAELDARLAPAGR